MLRPPPPAPPAAMIEFERVSIRHRTPTLLRCSHALQAEEEARVSVASVKEERATSPAAAERMKPPIHDASARQHSGGPSPVPGRGDNQERPSTKAELDRGRSRNCRIAELVDRSTGADLRLACVRLGGCKIEKKYGRNRSRALRRSEWLIITEKSRPNSAKSLTNAQSPRARQEILDLVARFERRAAARDRRNASAGRGKLNQVSCGLNLPDELDFVRWSS